MTRSERLYDFLTTLPDREFETGRQYEEQIIPEFYSILGYDLENVFYNVTVNVGTHTDFLDSFAGSTTESDPWLLVEVRRYTETSYPDHSDDIDSAIYRDLQKFKAISGTEYAVVLTNRAIGIKGPANQFGYDYHEISLDNCRQIVDLLEPPEEFTAESDHTELPSGDLGTISTDNFRMDLDIFHELLYDVLEAETPQAKGDRLEDVAESLLEAVPHFCVADRNLRTVTGEIDLVIENSEIQSAINCHSRYFLVECKNWNEPVGADSLRDFAGKLKSSKSNLGIIFARNGVSGSNQENAMGVINNTFQNDGAAIVVFTWGDLLDIRNGTSFYELLEKKIYNRRFPD